MPRILVIDDDPAISELVSINLEMAGYDVNQAEDGIKGQALAVQLQPDLVMLDLMLPKVDGFTVCQRLRRDDRTSDIPVLMLTALGQTQDKVEGFNAGADDYLSKPFEPKELLLRINAILRRVPVEAQPDPGPKVLSLGPVRYDIERGELWRGEDLVRLTATESALMRIFSGTPGEPVSRSQLVEDLGRDDGQAQERAVDVQITRLRRKIESDPKQPRYLQTVRGAGYMLAPD